MVVECIVHGKNKTNNTLYTWMKERLCPLAVVLRVLCAIESLLFDRAKGECTASPSAHARGFRRLKRAHAK